jgi:predicted HicB family RNase H-like nuclease
MSQQTPPAKRGRPKSGVEPRTTLAASVTVSRHAQVVRAANQARVSISTFVNQSIARTLSRG